MNDNLTPSIFFIPLFLFFTGILLFVALLYGEKDLAVFSLLLVVLYAGLKLWSLFSIREIKCRFLVDRERLFPDETVHLSIRIENNKLLPVFVKIRLSAGSFLQPDDVNAAINEEGGLLWYQGATFHRKFIAQKRGIYQHRDLLFFHRRSFRHFSTGEEGRSAAYGDRISATYSHKTFPPLKENHLR